MFKIRKFKKFLQAITHLNNTVRHIVCHVCPNALPVAISCPVFYPQKNNMADESNTKDQASSEVIAKQNQGESK